MQKGEYCVKITKDEPDKLEALFAALVLGFATRLAYFYSIGYSMVTLFYTYMSQDRLIQIKNKETGETYWTRKNKKNTEGKLELKKYSKTLRKHVTFKEGKK